eukprot:m.149763 g.149763  ORF g.149763 m.149763 type:complete len:57 (-) comp14249_c0_seq3:447-617(-)
MAATTQEQYRTCVIMNRPWRVTTTASPSTSCTARKLRVIAQHGCREVSQATNIYEP